MNGRQYRFFQGYQSARSAARDDSRGTGPRPRSARAPHRARGSGSGARRRTRSRTSEEETSICGISIQSRFGALGAGETSNPGRRATASRASRGSDAASCQVSERGELIGADQEDAGSSRDSDSRARAACRRCTTARSRSISRRDTVNIGLPSAAACARRRRISGDSCGAARCDGRPVGTSTTRSSPELPGGFLAEREMADVRRVEQAAEHPDPGDRRRSPLGVRVGALVVHRLGRSRRDEREAMVADRDLVARACAGPAERAREAEAVDLGREGLHALRASRRRDGRRPARSRGR